MAPEPSLVFTQESRGIKLIFEFAEQKLKITHADGAGENERTIAYEAIDLNNTSSVVLKSPCVKYPERFYFAAASVSIFLAFGPPPVVGIAAGALFLGWGIKARRARIKGVKYTVFKANEAVFRVMCDQHHDQIIGEMRRRWTTRLRSLFGAVSLANQPHSEIQKFRQLRAWGVITQEELDRSVAEIRAYHGAELPSVPVLVQ